MKDVVVIGGGHNGLVAAAALAQGGREVLLLEQREAFGGFCAPFEFYPGYRAAGLLYDTRCFRSTIVDALGLAEDGLELIESPGVQAATDGDSIVHLPEGVSSQGPDGAVSGYLSWWGAIERFRPVVRQLLDAAPPRLVPGDSSDLWRLGKQGLALRRLGKSEMLDLLRVLPMSVSDWLGEFLGGGLWAEALAFPAVQGGFFGPRAAGTAANLLMYESVAERAVRGGAVAVIESLVSNCTRSGVELRNQAAVRRIKTRRGRVVGVELESGEVVPTETVLATCHPQTAFQGLLDPAELPVKLEAEVRSIRTRGSAAKVHIALSRRLNLPKGYDPRVDRIRWCRGNMQLLERIFDPLKYGEMSDEFHLDLELASRTIPDLAPPGGEVISASLHCVPYRQEPDWNKQARARLAAVALDRLAQIDPDVRRHTLAVHVLTPRDLETLFGLVGGQIFHAERTLDQALMLRPCASLARYSTPIDGLFLGGSASHPGGGITGMPGYLAAQTVLG